MADSDATVTQFKGEIQVASRIIDALSSGLYQSPAACLKELVNNSYDADATSAKIFVKPEADQIIVEDDGVGMSREEFEHHFRRISESHKREATEFSASGTRPLIGKIGIGFIAANELCETMEMFSTKAGSRDLLHVVINFAEMRRDPSERRRSGDAYAKADFEGEVRSGEAELQQHYTQVFLTNVHGPARDMFIGARRRSDVTNGVSLYGLSPKSVERILTAGTVSSWTELDPYSETMLEVGLNVPIPYHEHWLPVDVESLAADLAEEVRDFDFNVFYDGSEQRKPIVLRPHEGSRVLLRRFEFAGQHLAARGYFYAQHGVIRPQNLNGVLVRIRQAAVGNYDRTFLQFPTSIGTLFQRWISAEIWAGDGLEAAMNIDRRTLRVTHPAYLELQHAVHAFLADFIREIRSEIHGEGVTERSSTRARDQSAQIDKVIADPALPLSAQSRERVVAAWKTPSSGEIDRGVLRTYTVSELYGIVLDAAAEVLTPTQLRRFVDILTRRLRGRRRRSRR